ncbi:uncharacterized protein LOC129046950 [Molothrus ater]|uniref:uncharacterized protein LOC129046950 n=1 Tax=Molothrus ater TaxID=84834 RepID=UPI0023E7E95C|nr:uncharacterized protein LOC129046950 [Molothrus ater]
MAPLPRVAAVIYSARELCPALAPAPASHPHPGIPPRTPTSHLAALSATLHRPSPPHTLVSRLARSFPSLHTPPLLYTLISHPAPSPPCPQIPPHTFPRCPTHSYPPHTLISHPTCSYPTLHTHILPHTLISHPAPSPPCPQIPPHTFPQCPTHSYPTPYIPIPPHTVTSLPTHPYPTPHTHIPPHTPTSHPTHSYPTPGTPHPAPHAPVTPRTFPGPVGTWGQASGLALSCCPLPGPILCPLARVPWHCRPGDPHPKPPSPPTLLGPLLGSGCPRPGLPAAPRPRGGSGGPGALFGVQGPAGQGGGQAPPPGLAFNILFDWFAWLCCRKTFANIPEQPGSV